MVCENKKGFCLFVGWLNIVLSFSIPIGQILLYAYEFQSHMKDVLDLNPLIRDENFHVLLYCACGFIPWLIASILLVKGIRQNRHKLMTPWIYLNYAIFIIGIPFMVYFCYGMSMFGGSLQIGLYYAILCTVGLVILLFCLIPVRKLHKNLANPPKVLPTH